MSEKRDAEHFTDLFISTIKSGLNTKIAAINTAKGDSLISAVDSNAYYYRSFGQKSPGYDPVVVFGVTTELGGEVEGEATETLVIGVEVVSAAAAEADPLQVMRKMLRYRRALIEVVQDNYRKFPNLSFDAIPDLSFTVDRQLYYAAGVVAKMVYPT